MPTALGTLRLRSSRAHSDRQPAVEVQQCPLRAEVGRRDWRRVGKAEVDVEVDADMVEEKLEEEEEEEAEDEDKEKEEENISDKIYQPSPGRWGKNSWTKVVGFISQLLELIPSIFSP